MSVLIIGAGHAGIQTAASLRDEGYEGEITVLSREECLPYQRPPLSKEHLNATGIVEPLPLRGAEFFELNDIELLRSVRVDSIDRQEKAVTLKSGKTLSYDHLVFATGAEGRELKCDGSELVGVYSLRTADDAACLNEAMDNARNVVVVGAGFIGLEFASTALKRGCEVTVLEFADRPMGRALTKKVGDWFAQAHRREGINLRLKEGIASFESEDGLNVSAAVSTTGDRYPADLVVVGIGVIANDRLAHDAGLATENGILVDETLRTSDPSIYAVGDCANFPSRHTGTHSRLESVQNASDHARHVAKCITGDRSPYTELPWFWSIQGPYRLQMAGIPHPDDETVVLGDPDSGKFSVLCFRDDALVAVESVNKPADHQSARKILGSGARIYRSSVEEESFSLREWAKSLKAPV